MNENYQYSIDKDVKGEVYFDKWDGFNFNMEVEESFKLFNFLETDKEPTEIDESTEEPIIDVLIGQSFDELIDELIAKPYRYSKDYEKYKTFFNLIKSIFVNNVRHY